MTKQPFFRTLATLVIFIVGGASAPTLFAQTSSKGELVERNIAYRTSQVSLGSYADSLCRLDIYYPANESNFATVIWYHGGGLTGGSKSDGFHSLLGHGFAVVSVGYRLSPHVGVEDCIDDAAAGAAWVVKNIAHYGGDPAKIYVAGHSAGGYLTSMITLDRSWLSKYEVDPDTTFVAAIPYSGHAITHFTRRAEMGLSSSDVVVDELAPISHIRPDCIPIMILTGDREMELFGRYEECAYMWRMLQLKGHPQAELYEFEGFDHGKMAEPAHRFLINYINRAR